jgi:hypothetical protein
MILSTGVIMRRALVLALTAILLSGCETTDPAAVQNAEIFFLPRFRYVDEPRFCFDAAERERALQEYKKLGADTLLEFVIDNQGHVRKTRLVKTDQPKHRHEDIVAHARVMTFTEDPESSQYRAFYFPMEYTYKSEVEWVDR